MKSQVRENVKLIFFLATCAFLLIYQIFRSEPNEKDLKKIKIVFIGAAFAATNATNSNKCTGKKQMVDENEA